MAKIVSVNISARTGEKKRPVKSVYLVENFGAEGDAHADSGTDRQVSLLAVESIEKMRQKGLDVSPGDFAENITTEGIALVELKPSMRVQCGESVLEITRIGKECHERCAIYYQAGDCVMPHEGVFAKVIRGGTVRPGDAIIKLTL